MKKIIIISVLLAATGLFRQLNASDRDTLKPAIPAVRIDKPIALTGKLDDPQWLKAIPVDLGYEILPGENIAPKQKTTVLILYDQENLYVGFRCYDSVPGNIRAHLSDRDKIFNDDYVIVTIDTYNDYQKAFELAVNPFGIQGDLLMMGAGNEDTSYDMVWYSAASRDNEGWKAELAIPFKALSFSAAGIQDWTITLIRSIPRNNRYIVGWTPYDRNNPSWIAQGGLLKGLQGIKPGKSLELLPFTMVQQSGERETISDPSSSLKRGKVKARAGGGITYSPGPNTTLNAVFNPDFSQIESDAAQISVNTTFALYYPERRPFFMSGMDLLQTPMYYSRTINNPLYATKVNGKAGKISYLALGAYDRNTAITVPGEESSNTINVDRNSYVGVGRIRYDLGKENFFGALALTRDFRDGHNYLGGLDWNFKFWKNWYWQGELFLTNTREINDSLLFKSARMLGSTGHDAGFNGENYYGTGMHLALMRAGRKYGFTLVQNNFSPTYQTYNGMFPEVNGRQSFMSHRYTFHINKKIIQRIRLSTNIQFNYNYDNVLKRFSFQPGFGINMIGQTSLIANYLAMNRERFRNILFSGVNRLVFQAQSTPAKGLQVAFSGQVGKFIYRSSNPLLGRGYNLETQVGLEPFSWFKTSVSWSAARLKNTESGTEFYDGHILRNISNLQFSRKIFLRNILQYNTFSKAISVYPLLSYKFNAFTMFCAGMTQDMMDYEMQDYAFRTTGYQYFVKLQYLFSI